MEEATAREIELKTNHFRFAAKQWGEKSGEKVLALHGWLDNAASFDHLAPHLQGLNLVALDFPGHGYSAHRPLGVKYHYFDYVADVINALDVLKWDRCHLVGHSLGAGVASLTAASFPERVEKLVLIEGIAPLTSDPMKSAEYLSRSINQMKAVSGRKPHVYQKKSELVDARSRVGDMDRSSVEALVNRGIVELEDGIIWRSDPRLKVASPGYLVDEQVSAFLKQIEAETLLIYTNSGLFSNRQQLDLKACNIKRLEKVELDGGHHIHLDNPESVASHINLFL